MKQSGRTVFYLIVTGIVLLVVSIILCIMLAAQSGETMKTSMVFGVAVSAIAGAAVIVLTAGFRKRLRDMGEKIGGVSDGIDTLIRETSPGTDIPDGQEPAGLPGEDEVDGLENRIRALESKLSDRIALVRSQAVVDGLTGLGNRKAYEERVRKVNDEIREGKKEFTVAVFDLNGLKEINDYNGHDTGDEAIASVAEALKQVFGDGQIYRVGGDEFVVILDGVTEDIQIRLSKVSRITGEKYAVNVANGYAEFAPEKDMGYRDVFRRADNAMYENKKSYYQGLWDRRKRED